MIFWKDYSSFGRQLGLDGVTGWSPHDEISDLKRGTAFPFCLHTKNRSFEYTEIAARYRPRPQATEYNLPWGHLDCRLTRL